MTETKKRKAGLKRAAPKKRARKAAAASRGPLPAECALEDLDSATREAKDRVEKAGGLVLAAYRDPLGKHPLLLAVLPLDKVEPTPFQRDVSDMHHKRLADVIDKTGYFLDPIIAVTAPGHVFWTPNGGHRLAAMRRLGARSLSALVVPQRELAWQILALNTEKAHNLKEKSLEVIRMYRGLVDETPAKDEESFAFQFESAHFITLGLLYEQNKRFAGGAFAPILRRVDKFLKGHLPKTLKEREERAALVREADEALGGAVARIKKRGINHPYVKNYVLARTTPLTRQRKTLPGFEQTFRKLVDNIEAFDVSKVRYEDIQRSAIMAVPAG
jgi:ParB family chromosome partitioning protein